MPSPQTCERCGTALVSLHAGALCPNCLLHEALGVTSPAGVSPGAAAKAPDPIVASRVIGPYKLLEQIGEGGMGTVWMAEQTQPIRRRVALKIIKQGMDSGSILARFEAERQALALMDHPNIAKVLDAGSTPEGRPYFVMELVKGIPLTKFCDEQRLSIRERLELFMPVCQAIQHAHQKGVIHRDIKPGNVLVALYDGRPVPKVIDFGIAKATGQQLTERTLFTGFGALIGTPEYMSPEQAELNQLDIDTRSDIYSLGVLLYELLTGTTPLNRETLRQAAFDEVLRRVREEEPPRPSTRLTLELARIRGSQRAGSGAGRKSESEKVGAEAGPQDSSHRPTSPPAHLPRGPRRDSSELQRLIPLLRGDLDWVVMKALEKDRTRRYETSNGLALDLQRHLDNEPVVARPPSNVYRFQKLVRRNKLAFAAASAVTASLIAGLGLATWMFFREKEHRQRADSAERTQFRLREEADVARNDEAHARAKAEKQESVTQQNLYAADIRLSQLALEQGDFGRARSLLTAHFPLQGQPDLRGFEWRYLWNLSRGEQLQVFRGHSNAVSAVAFAPDGRMLATGSWDSTVRLWDCASGTCLAVFSDSMRHVDSVAISRDGRILAAGHERGVELWDLRSLRHIQAFDGKYTRVAFSPSDHLLAIGEGAGRYGEGTGSVTLWDYATTRMIRHFPDAGGRPAFSPDGRILATASSRKQIHLWDIASGQKLRSIDDGESILSMSFSHDGRSLFASNLSGEINTFDTATGEPVNRVKVPGEVFWGIALSPDGTTLAGSGVQRVIRLYDLMNGRPPSGHAMGVLGQNHAASAGAAPRMERTQLKGHTSTILGVAFSPDGEKLATASKDETAMLWGNTSTKDSAAITNVFIDRWNWLGHPIFSPDGKLLASAKYGNDDAVKVWNVATLQTLMIFTNAELPVAFMDEGKTLVTCSTGLWSLQYWDLTTQSNCAVIPMESDGKHFCSALSPAGNTFALGFQDGRVRLLDAFTGRKLETLRGVTNKIFSLSFSPDARLLAASTYSRGIFIWDLSTRSLVANFNGHTDSILCVAFSPDGKLLASGSTDNTTKIWDVATRTELATLSGHHIPVIRLAFSPDGRTLAVASDTSTIKLWNLATYREVADVDPQTKAGACFLAFSPDGQTLAASRYKDGTVRLWRAPFQLSP